ncbi:hypothetical protein ACG7TL_008313 [Trametes sanguinea]
MAYGYTTTRTTRRESRYFDNPSQRPAGGSVGYGSRSGRSHGGDVDAGFPGFSPHPSYTPEYHPPTPPRPRGRGHEWDFDDDRSDVTSRRGGSDTSSILRGSARDIPPPLIPVSDPLPANNTSTRGRSSARSSRRQLEYDSPEDARARSVTPTRDGALSDYGGETLVSPAVAAGSSRRASQMTEFSPVIPPLPRIPEHVTEVRETWHFAPNASPISYTRTTTTTSTVPGPPVYAGPSMTLTVQPMMGPVVPQPPCPPPYLPPGCMVPSPYPGIPFQGNVEAGWYYHH